MADYQFHEISNIFPMMSEEEYLFLKDDIEQNGQIEPIWIHQKKIIDGRNRYRACKELGIKPELREWDGKGSLVSFVVSLNLKRRHLSSGQKAVVALEVEKWLAQEAKEKESTRKTTFQKTEKSNAAPIHAAEQAAKITGTIERNE
jgi:ParB-like chromosome segregation protein Spo0J